MYDVIIMYRFNEINLKPIGFVNVDLSEDEIKSSLDGVRGVVEIYPEYEDGLHGIEDFSHIILIAYLHKVSENQRKTLKVRPRRWLRYGIDISDIPQVGVFCTDSPHRPNPIAITIVHLIKRERNKLFVEGLDLYNNTPIIDIKPYTPSRVIRDLKLPKWYIELSTRISKRFNKIIEI